ncbi:antibiotic biosynthesis monooxygenase [Candidatus Gracilibacteria bacterium]|nr:antibiotic biosynthesis monooxygenase [Candidatus Gracilibacteria bacterium]
MIIVSGRIYVHPGTRQDFVTSSAEAVVQARRTPDCRDFVVAADPLEPDRVNIYEEWESEEALLAFRGDGPGEDLGASILRAEVSRHVIASSGPA